MKTKTIEELWGEIERENWKLNLPRPIQYVSFSDDGFDNRFRNM